MNTIELSKKLIVFVENRPTALKTLTEAERKLFVIACKAIKSQKEDILSPKAKQLTDLLNKVMTPITKSQIGCCSSGFLHLIRSLFKGILNSFGLRTGSDVLVKKAHKTLEGLLGNPKIAPDIRRLLKENGFLTNQEILSDLYENFRNLQLIKYASQKKLDLEKEKDLILSKNNRLFYQSFTNEINFKNYLYHDCGVVGTKCKEGEVKAEHIDAFIDQLENKGIIGTISSESKDSDEHELKNEFEELNKDFELSYAAILNHFYELHPEESIYQNGVKVPVEPIINQEIEYRRDCIQTFQGIIADFNVIMDLYDKDTPERENFVRLQKDLGSEQVRYPDYKQRFKSNMHTETKFGFVIHAEHPRAEVEIALKLGPKLLIGTYKKAKEAGPKALFSFFINAFNTQDACFEAKNTSIGNFVEAELSGGDSNTPLGPNVETLINNNVDKKKNMHEIFEVFMDRQARKYCSEHDIDISNLKPSEWVKKKNSELIYLDKFNSHYFNRDQLLKFLRNDVKAVGKLTADGVIKDSDLNFMTDYAVSFGLFRD